MKTDKITIEEIISSKFQKKMKESLKRNKRAFKTLLDELEKY